MLLVICGLPSLGLGIAVIEGGLLFYHYAEIAGRGPSFANLEARIVTALTEGVVTNEWRLQQGLPPRRRIEVDTFSPGYSLWRDEGAFLWARSNDGTGVPERILIRRMFDARVGLLLTAPDSVRPFWVVLVAAVAFAGWSFLVLAAVCRTWLVMPSLRRSPARPEIVSATTFGAGVLCLLPKLMLVSWVFTLPFWLEVHLGRFNWEPWTCVQRVLFGTRIPAAWSVAMAMMCWLTIAFLASALRSPARWQPDAHRLQARLARVLLWALPVLLIHWLVLSFLLARPVVPSMLGPWPE